VFLSTRYGRLKPMANPTTGISADDLKDAFEQVGATVGTPATPTAIDDANNDLQSELDKAQAIEDALDHTFKALKDPGERKSPSWDVAIVSYLTVKELMDVFKRPWIWGASVLGVKFKGQEITEWGFVGPEGQEWSLRATWQANKEIPKEKNVDWRLGGTHTDYDEFILWLGKRLNRQLPVTPTDADCVSPRRVGITEVFGTVIQPVESDTHSPVTVTG